MRLSRATVYALIAVLAVGLVGSGLATGAGKKVKAKTKVTIRAQGSDYDDKFLGKAKAKPKKVSGKAKKKFKKKCKKKRKVTVFHKVSGGKEKVGSRKSNKKGKWTVKVNGLADPGKYFAVAKKKKVKVKTNAGKRKGVCKKGKSKKVTVT